MVGKAQCFIAVSVKNRVFWIIAALKIRTKLSLDDVAAKTIQELPFRAQDFGELEVRREGENDLITLYGPTDRQLSIVVARENGMTAISIGRRSPSIQKQDAPGFYAD